MSKLASFIQQNPVTSIVVLLAVVLCGVFVSQAAISPEVRKAANSINSYLDVPARNPHTGDSYGMELSGEERRVAARMASSICEGDLAKLQRLIASVERQSQSRMKIGSHLTKAFWRAGTGYIVIFRDQDESNLVLLEEDLGNEPLGLMIESDESTVFCQKTGEVDPSVDPEAHLKAAGRRIVDNVNSGRLVPKDN